jgi:hypothetical protein
MDLQTSATNLGALSGTTMGSCAAGAGAGAGGCSPLTMQHRRGNDNGLQRKCDPKSHEAVKKQLKVGENSSSFKQPNENSCGEGLRKRRRSTTPVVESRNLSATNGGSSSDGGGYLLDNDNNVFDGTWNNNHDFDEVDGEAFLGDVEEVRCTSGAPTGCFKVSPQTPEDDSNENDNGSVGLINNVVSSSEEDEEDDDVDGLINDGGDDEVDASETVPTVQPSPSSSASSSDGGGGGDNGRRQQKAKTVPWSDEETRVFHLWCLTFAESGKTPPWSRGVQDLGTSRSCASLRSKWRRHP